MSLVLREKQQNHNEVSHTRQDGYYPNKDTKCWRGCGEKGTLVHREGNPRAPWVGTPRVQPLWKIVRGSSKIKSGTAMGSRNPVTGYLSKRAAIRTVKNTSMHPVSTAARLTILGNRPHCPCAGERTKETRQAPPTGQHSASRRGGNPPQTRRRRPTRRTFC